MSQTNIVEKIKTHFIFNNFLVENRAVYEIIWKKSCRTKQATDDDMAHAPCMLHT